MPILPLTKCPVFVTKDYKTPKAAKYGSYIVAWSRNWNNFGQGTFV